MTTMKNFHYIFSVWKWRKWKKKKIERVEFSLGEEKQKKFISLTDQFSFSSFLKIISRFSRKITSDAPCCLSGLSRDRTSIISSTRTVLIFPLQLSLLFLWFLCVKNFQIFLFQDFSRNFSSPLNFFIIEILKD